MPPIGRFLIRPCDLMGAPRGRTGLFFAPLAVVGTCGDQPPSGKWGGRGRPAGHAAVPPAARRLRLLRHSHLDAAPRHSLPDLGPVLSPPGFCCLPVSCSGAPKFCLWGPKTGATCGARGMFDLIERKAKSNAGGSHMLLIIMWPDNTLAILLLQLLLNELLLAPFV
jgi:hypothetical protein